ncbi:MAG: 2-amino-4-hydroxy-6-hydroxymethyldihydropteridine diphosphokinase [Acidimicrobiia bacterium]|nr:2-amino-4-hydroxy-6-hydroxymethyldihydropteridine diphosphokinase [Acidimicrobiia bacterium]
MTLAYLGLGSNLGERLANLQRAVDGLGSTPGISVLAVSAVYETEPVGGPQQPEFLNAVVELETSLTPRELLEVAKRLESEAERERGERWGPRTLDVDVLIVGSEEVDEADLVVPHPRLLERGFVRAPLDDVVKTSALPHDLQEALAATASTPRPGVTPPPHPHPRHERR